MTLCTGVAGVVLVSRSLSSRSGATACSAISAPSTAKSRSTMTPLPLIPPLPQPGEEIVNGLPRLRAAGKPAPAGPDQADKCKAAVDRNPVIFASAFDAIDQQGLDVRLDFGQAGVARYELAPRVEAEEGLGGAGGAGIERDRPPVRCAMKQERHVDRQPQSVPLGVGHPEIDEPSGIGRHDAVSTARSCSNRADAIFASTEQAPAGRLYEMRVSSAERGSAQLHRSIAGEPTNRRNVATQLPRGNRAPPGSPGSQRHLLDLGIL